MAKYAAGYLSPIKNKLGNAVGRKWRNIDVLAVYQPDVKNPRTTKQMATRNRLSLASHAGSMLRAAIRLGLKGITDGTSVFPRAKFVSLNVAQMPESGLTIPYAKIIVAKGSSPIADFGQVDLSTPQTAKVEWTIGGLDSIFPASVVENMKVYIVVLNVDLGVSLVSRPVAFDDGQARVTIPDAWNGMNVHVWGFTRYEGETNDEVNLKAGMASDSTYLGSGTVN